MFRYGYSWGLLGKKKQTKFSLWMHFLFKFYVLKEKNIGNLEKLLQFSTVGISRSTSSFYRMSIKS